VEKRKEEKDSCLLIVSQINKSKPRETKGGGRGKKLKAERSKALELCSPAKKYLTGQGHFTEKKSNPSRRASTA